MSRGGLAGITNLDGGIIVPVSKLAVNIGNRTAATLAQGAGFSTRLLLKLTITNKLHFPVIQTHDLLFVSLF